MTENKFYPVTIREASCLNKPCPMFPLSPIFREKLIPWSENDLANRLVVARPVLTAASLPYGVQLAPKKFLGKRVPIHNRRIYANQHIYRARWPEEQLHELYVPKLVCVTKGVTNYRAGEYVITCGEGHFILLPPFTPNTTGGQPHLEGENRQHGSCDLIQFLLLNNSIQCMSCSSRGEKHYDATEKSCFVRNFQAVQLFNLFVEEALKEQSNAEISSHLLSAFFRSFFRDLEEEGTLRRINYPVSPNTSSDDLLQEIQAYIKGHLRQQLTIEMMARLFHMSPSQFTRYLRRTTGLSFVDMLTEYRLEEAKVLLREAQWTVRHVADLVGFKSHTYFNALFRRKVGCSPGEYRKNQQSADKK